MGLLSDQFCAIEGWRMDGRTENVLLQTGEGGHLDGYHTTRKRDERAQDEKELTNSHVASLHDLIDSQPEGLGAATPLPREE